MKETLFAEYAPEERKQMLEDNADEVLEKNYTRKFNSAEKNIRRARNSEIDLELAEIDEELKAFKEKVKNKREPLVTEKKKILDEIKADGEYIKGTVYKMIDREKKEVNFYDEEGVLVESRRLTNADKQVTMKFSRATGTDNY